MAGSNIINGDLSEEQKKKLDIQRKQHVNCLISEEATKEMN